MGLPAGNAAVVKDDRPGAAAALAGVDDLLVGFGESRLGGVGIGVALDVAKQPQQDLDGFEIGLGRAVDELG